MLKKLFMSKKVALMQQPQPRWGHSCVAVNNKAILWGGMQNGLPAVHDNELKTKFLSKIEVFDVFDGKWEQQQTYGYPPLGVRGHACSAVQNDIYYFGGFCGHDWCRHNSLHCFNFVTNSWKEIVPQSHAKKSPMKKSRCGMFHFKNDDGNYLCVFGGTGSLNSANHPNATYIPWRDNPDWGWTNEIHFFDLRNGHWITPSVFGDCPPPCAGFTLTKISNNSAVLLGGYRPDNNCTLDVYLITVSTNSVMWKKLEVDYATGPLGRQDHTTVCVSSKITGHDYTVLLLIGGRDSQGHTLSDCWLFNVESVKWTKVLSLDTLTPRHFHSAVSVSLSANSTLLILFGGVSDWSWSKTASEQSCLAATVILEAICCFDNEWRFRVHMNETDTVPSESYVELINKISEVTETADGSDGQLVTTTVAQDELDISCNPSPIELNPPYSIYDNVPPDGHRREDTLKVLKRKLVIAQGRGEDIEEELHQAVINAEDRAVVAEEKLRVAETKISFLEEQMKQSEFALKVSKEKVCETYSQVIEYSEQVIQLEKQILDSESRAIDAEIALNEVQTQYNKGHILSLCDDLKLPNVAFQDGNDIIIKYPLSSFHTLEDELCKREVLTKKEIVSVSIDIANALQYVCNMSHLKFHLNALSVLLEPCSSEDKKWNAKLIVTLPSDDLTDSSINSNINYNFSLLLIRMATGINNCSYDNIDNILSKIDWPPLTELIKMCNDNYSIQDILHFIETMNC